MARDHSISASSSRPYKDAEDILEHLERPHASFLTVVNGVNCALQTLSNPDISGAKQKKLSMVELHIVEAAKQATSA
ncbi:uncharacterized protein N7515_000076 [Penicillium bovifimosum]|uniref:Uncharacterized protein n=1 Tax=Penicillium bovifimosum TaxID=126998 RepID=A0A9W9LAS6_9EURO|nr:uncharacterized protein N7515_000076 [Penicillium bovifimosum]KAJ5145512.1 hypothetical protein N7515_000076 [Penicillium bovifimosum]